MAALISGISESQFTNGSRAPSNKAPASMLMAYVASGMEKMLPWLPGSNTVTTLLPYLIVVHVVGMVGSKS
jgi:hypothetical protein